MKSQSHTNNQQAAETSLLAASLSPNAKTQVRSACADLSCKFWSSWNCWNLPKVLWELTRFYPLIYLYFVWIVLSSYDECKTCLSFCLRLSWNVLTFYYSFAPPAPTTVPCSSVQKINMFRGGDNRWEVEAYISTFLLRLQLIRLVTSWHWKYKCPDITWFD